VQNETMIWRRVLHGLIAATTVVLVATIFFFGLRSQPTTVFGFSRHRVLVAMFAAIFSLGTLAFAGELVDALWSGQARGKAFFSEPTNRTKQPTRFWAEVTGYIIATAFVGSFALILVLAATNVRPPILQELLRHALSSMR